MKTLKAIFIMIWILSMASAESALPDKQEPEWPKKLDTEDAQISIYQPQVNSLEGDILDARAALSVKQKGEKLVFGAMWFNTRLVTDYDTRQVTLTEIDIELIKFPEAGEEGESAMMEMLENKMPEMDLTFSLDRLLTSLEMAEQSTIMSEKLNHAPPKIIFEDEAAVMVLIDGEPILKDIEDTKIQYVVNTPYYILYNKADGFFYLKGGDWWYRAGRVENTWRHIATPPSSITQITPSEEGYETDVDSIARTLEYPPKVILSKVPAELIITDGEPDFATLEGTDILYVRNTESEILMDINDQDFFVLIAGRWYKSKSLDSENWEFVNPDELPDYFANIASDSEIGSVRSAVPNTQEAREAVLENEIPQTAEIDRSKASIEVNYDGNPQFEKIQGTRMAYAANTDKSVLLIDNRYYAVDNAVWFVSDRATGPWEVCVSVPDDVQSIPPEYPVYNVKYVHVYDYTPDVVYVGYTPGYTYSYRYHGTVVYGTGYYYRPWYRTYYYPRPVTYGYGVHYNPYTGWGFSTGISYGWIGYSYHRSPYYYSTWWGPAGYRYGHRHGYYHGYNRSYYRGYYHGYNYGVYASSRSGYRAGYYDGHHHHSHSHNIYKSVPAGVIHTGTRASSTTYGSRSGSSASRSSYSSPATTDRKNNVYTDRNGNVYRKKGDSWQSREEGSWKKSDVPERRTGSTTTSRTTDSRVENATRTRESSGTSTSRNTTTSRTTTTRTAPQSTYNSRSRSSGAQELSRESQARSQGSQRTYNYQQTKKSTASPSRTRSSSGSSAVRSTSRSSTTKSSGTTRTSRTSTSGAKKSTAGERRR